VAGETDSSTLRDALTREVTSDAYVIAGQIFKTPDGDIARVSNDQLDERYRQAFITNDRNYLMAEAGRDPAQFLASMQRLGVQMPPGQEVQPEAPLPRTARSNAPIPKAPPSAVQQLFPTPQEVPTPPLPQPSVVGAPPVPVSVPPLVVPPATGGGLTAPPAAVPPPPGVIA